LWSDYEAQKLRNYSFLTDAKGRRRSVDIRFVSFIADKFSGTGYLLKELDIKNAPASLWRVA
jgi:hypothetical protein